MANDIKFFERDKKNNNLLKTVQNKRSILITMLESGTPLSVREISSKSNVLYSVTYETIHNFVKANLATPITVAQYQSRKDSKYELTKNGVLFALVVSFDQGRVLGNKKMELQKVFQPEKGTDTITYFIFNVMLNALNYGLYDYTLRFLQDIVIKAESSSELNLWKLAQNVVASSNPEELTVLNQAVVQALNSLSESDKDMVVQRYRSKIIDQLFDVGTRAHDSSILELARLSQKDPYGIYIKFACKGCRYVNDQQYLLMENVIVNVFTGGLLCPQCNRFIPNSESVTKAVKHKIKRIVR